MEVRLDTGLLIDNCTGKNKAFLTKVAKTQEQKYGNVDIFECDIYNIDDIEIYFGDYSIRFFFRNDKVYDTLGNGQGHKYHQSLQSVVEEIRELHKNYELKL